MTESTEMNVRKIKVKRVAFAIRDFICINYVEFGMP